MLRGTEERYPPMEKLAFALVIAICKLKPYFQAHYGCPNKQTFTKGNE